MIYIIDDNQYGELSKACGYIETGIYNDVVRWVKPSKETKVEDFHDVACICYHSSLAIKENGVWKQASMLLTDIEDLMEEIPLVKYSKGCTTIDYDEKLQIIYGMPKETFYKRLKHFVQHYKKVGKVDLEIFSNDYLETSSPNNIVVFGNEENLSSSQLLKQANKCEFYNIDDDKDIDDIIFLDLRLMACEENKDLKVMEFSGMKVLQGIKQANPGNQVIIFTASSKSWNLKALIDNGADEYYLKESPLFHFSKEESRENAKHLVKTIGYCYRRSYLRKSYKLVEGIKEKINASPRLNENNRKETIAQLDMAFHQLLKITGTNNRDSFAYTFVAFEFVIPLLCKHLSAVGSNTPKKFEDLINTQLATSDTKLIYDGKQMIQARNAYMHGNKIALKSNFSFVFHEEGILKILKLLDEVSQLL